jgi:hypothetical protein
MRMKESSKATSKRGPWLWFSWLLGGAFAGAMVASLGPVVYPPLEHIGAPFICQGGTIRRTETHFSYRPGKSGVTFSDYCEDAKGKRNITFALPEWVFLICVPAGMVAGLVSCGAWVLLAKRSES